MIMCSLMFACRYLKCFGSVYLGFSFHSSSSEWVIGYHKFIGLVSPLQAELWSILIGLHVAWSQGIERLQVQTDCDQATRLLCTSSLEAARLPLVRAINSLHNWGWLTELQWIPCEGNIVADAMSKLSIPQQFQLSFFDYVLTSIRPFLDHDIDGPPYRRHAHP
ncbi:hypothetical protein V6N12_045094 [Hibiscus sabdariffa]|uniref:RNase H type-1 domain-containing protein n=1 Tax=Hibiscus sabdariffa TaxID=183260 RepID=A0ABR2G290_9ROSI